MHFDLIIIGGGMVGASLACALSPHDIKIALVDASPLNQPEDPRLIALNDSSVSLLKNIDAWPLIKPHATPIRSVHVSERGRFGKVTLSANELDMTSLGHVVPAKYLNAGLMQHLDHQASRLTLFRPASLTHLSQSNDAVSIKIKTADSELTLTAKCVIGADGTQSKVRELLNLSTTITDYHQSALVTISELNRHHQHIAYERFTGLGAIAMLPLTDNTCATIWTETNDAIDQLMEQDEKNFVAHLQEQFGYRLGKITRVQKRHRYPLKMILANQLVKNRVLLIGNAAHTLSPIAAQGLNLAFSEIAKLTETLITQLPKEHPLQWDAYLGWQQTCQQNSAQLSHRLMEIFGSHSFFIKALRPLGLVGLDLMGVAKNHFVKQAMARHSESPALLKNPDKENR